MPRHPLYVTTEAFDLAIDRLVGNFDRTILKDDLKPLVEAYRRVFTDDPEVGRITRCPQAGDYTLVAVEPRDHLLERGVDWLLDHRTERGMPRVAEVRAAVDDLADGDTMLRQTRVYLDDQRTRDHDLRRQDEEKRRGF